MTIKEYNSLLNSELCKYVENNKHIAKYEKVADYYTLVVEPCLKQINEQLKAFVMESSDANYQLELVEISKILYSKEYMSVYCSLNCEFDFVSLNNIVAETDSLIKVQLLKKKLLTELETFKNIVKENRKQAIINLTNLNNKEEEKEEN